MSKVIGAVEAGLKGKSFVGGDKPGPDDVKLFNQLLGEGNTHLHRWVKNMASFTEAERNAFPAAKPAKQAFSFAEAPKEKAAPVKEAPKVFRVNVVVEITIKAGAKKENLEGLMKQVQVQGLSFGAVKAAGDKLVWSPTIEQNKVTKEDLLDMTEGFHNYVEKATFTTWKPFSE